MADVFVPLNAFKSVISELTGEEDNVYNTPDGVSTIILSAQLTNTGNVTQPVTVLLKSNVELAIPQFDSYYSGSSFISESVSIANFSGSFQSASALIELNKSFIENETFSYLTFQNNLLEVPLTLDSVEYRKDINAAVDAVNYDITNNTTIRTKKVADLYYDKNGVSLIPTGQVSASVSALDYSNYLINQIVLNQSVTGSQFVSRLYQTSFTQSFNDYTFGELEYSSSMYVINNLYNTLVNNIESPIRVEQPPVDLIRNVDIPAKDSLSPVVAGKLVLEQNYGLIVSASSDVKIILSLLESANE
jgi:hypothetical protein